MSSMRLSKKELRHVSVLVEHFCANHHQFVRIAAELNAAFTTSPALKPLIHSLKWRIKEPDHLSKKLIRKWLEAKGKGHDYNVTCSNLFQKINDLVGFRVLHLYTKQMELLNPALIGALSEGYQLIDGPTAKTWDDESRAYFRGIGVATERSEKMYTSVHYVFKTPSVTKFTCEVQVRTLAEELWGEVDHSLNYPEEVDVLACSEQIKVLARLTSTCSRLVDSIYRSWESPQRRSRPRGAARREIAR